MPNCTSADWIAIADGDQIGELLDSFVLANDTAGLVGASRAIDSDRERLAEWFRMQGAVVLLCVADTVIALGEGSPPDVPYPELASAWSVGIGRDLRRAHAALAVAKATGRARVVDGRDWSL